MEVRGVRRSWDTARRRLPRIRSFSASAFICSCRLSWVVRVLVMMDTHQHHHRRGQTLRADQVERPVGIGEGVIHGHDAGQRGNNPPEIPLRPPCDQEHAQHEGHGRHGRDTEPLEQRQIQGKCRHQNDRRIGKVPRKTRLCCFIMLTSFVLL